MKKLILFAVFMLATSVIYANTIQVAYVAVEAGGDENVTFNGGGHSGANGLMAINTQNPVGPLASLISPKTWAYCNEIGASTDFPFTTYTVQTLDAAIGSSKAGLISQLWAQNYNPAWQSDTYIYFGGSYGGWQPGEPGNTLENQQALAMVLAIYEINYDFDTALTDLNLSTGIFKANSTNPVDAITIAQGWLSALVLPGDYTGPTAQLLSLQSPNLQDIIVEVPEPATMVLLGLGGLLLRKRK